MNELQVTLVRVEGAHDLSLPKYMTPLAAGMDLVANVYDEQTIMPGEFSIVPCGIMLELPAGFEAQIRPRSGLAAKYGITILNSPGTIDADYRGEIKAILVNHGKKNFLIKRGDRIAQMVFAKAPRARIIESDTFNQTQRGSGGFGHTGI